MKKIAMVDIDGVVFNEKYKTTKDISGTIFSVSKEMLFVPNSDTPISRMKKYFREALNYECEMAIGENGAVVSCGDNLVLTSNIKGVGSYRKSATEILETLGGVVYVGDTADLKAGIIKPPCQKKIAFIDSERVQSAAIFFLYCNIDGFLEINEGWSRQCLEVLKKKERPVGMSEYVYNPNYGIAISGAIAASKTQGYLAFRKFYPNSRYYMIGDSDADVINDDRVKKLSVANGSSLLKKEACYVSPLAVTGGLEDCIKWIKNDS